MKLVMVGLTIWTDDLIPADGLKGLWRLGKDGRLLEVGEWRARTRWSEYVVRTTGCGGNAYRPLAQPGEFARGGEAMAARVWLRTMACDTRRDDGL